MHTRTKWDGNLKRLVDFKYSALRRSFSTVYIYYSDFVLLFSASPFLLSYSLCPLVLRIYTGFSMCPENIMRIHRVIFAEENLCGSYHFLIFIHSNPCLLVFFVIFFSFQSTSFYALSSFSLVFRVTFFVIQSPMYINVPRRKSCQMAPSSNKNPFQR